jgi:hypothetical protein
MDLLWQLTSDNSSDWLMGRMNIQSNTPFRIAFEGLLGDSTYDGINIEEINFLDRPCEVYPLRARPSPTSTPHAPTTTTFARPPIGQFDCDFEKDLCEYTVSMNGWWKRTQGIRGTVSPNGPINKDHTLGSIEGWYLYFDPIGRVANDKAIVESPQLTGPKCLFFYYYIASNTPFSFDVYITSFVQSGAKLLWSRTTSQGDFWKMGRISLQVFDNLNPTDNIPYEIYFQMETRAYASQNDKYALDDIIIEDGPCVDGSEVGQLCTFTNADTCGYSADQLNGYRWKIYLPTGFNSQNVKNPNMLDYDHTSNAAASGYMYADNTDNQGRTVNGVATLSSSDYTDPFGEQRCIEFYYFLIGSVEFNLKARIVDNKTYDIWSRNYEHGRQWWKAEALVKLTSQYKLVFEVDSRNSSGLVGLDDVLIKSGPCSRYLPFL